jgi:hypothetical protein
MIMVEPFVFLSLEVPAVARSLGLQPGLVHPVGYLEDPLPAAGGVDDYRSKDVRVGFQIVGEVIPLCHNTTASHALVQASRSSVVVQAQISVQSLASPIVHGLGPAGITYEPYTWTSVHSAPVGLWVTLSPGSNCVMCQSPCCVCVWIVCNITPFDNASGNVTDGSKSWEPDQIAAVDKGRLHPFGPCPKAKRWIIARRKFGATPCAEALFDKAGQFC